MQQKVQIYSVATFKEAQQKVKVFEQRTIFCYQDQILLLEDEDDAYLVGNCEDDAYLVGNCKLHCQDGKDAFWLATAKSFVKDEKKKILS